MEKPASMSLKEWLIKKASKNLIVPEKIINIVITHQFDGANEALKDNKSVELYEFGKFIFNDKKAHHQMNKYLSQREVLTNIYNNTELSDKKRRNAFLKLQSVEKNIKVLKPKLNDGNVENI